MATRRTLSIQDVIALARQAGFSGPGLITAVAVALAESSLDPLNISHNPGSIDRGLWQINSKYHSEVPDVCAFDPLCNAKAAYQISKGGTDWSQWTTFKTGAYKQFTDKVKNVLFSIPGTVLDSGGGSIPTSTSPISTPNLSNFPSVPTGPLGEVPTAIQEGLHYVTINAGLVAVAGIGLFLLFRKSFNG